MPPPRNPEVTLTIDVQALNKMLVILGKQPFEEVADLIVDLRNQAQAQLSPMTGMRPNGGDHMEGPQPPAS